MFRESIRKVIDRVDGGVAGIVMGFDGIAVESYTRAGDGADIQTVGMELAHVIGQMRRAAEGMEAGGVSEVTMRAQRLHVLVHVLSDEYFVACALRPDANFGKARYVMRLVVPEIRSEL